MLFLVSTLVHEYDLFYKINWSFNMLLLSGSESKYMGVLFVLSPF